MSTKHIKFKKNELFINLLQYDDDDFLVKTKNITKH